MTTQQHASQGPIQKNAALEQEFMEIRERLKQTESQLQHADIPKSTSQTDLTDDFTVRLVKNLALSDRMSSNDSQ